METKLAISHNSEGSICMIGGRVRKGELRMNIRYCRILGCFAVVKEDKEVLVKNERRK